jgi:hypothetical protein
MFTAFIFASLSAVCMALMVVTDRLMVGDCYKNNPDHAWFVSSVAGSVFGLFLTFIVWVFGHTIIEIPGFGTLFETAGTLFIPKGVLAFILGVVGIQILLHYFRCFSERAHSSVLAAWIAATPIFVLLTVLLISTLSAGVAFDMGSMGMGWILGVLLATAGLVIFERITGGPGGNVGTYRRELIMLLLLSVVYTIGLKQVFSFHTDEEGALTEAVALMPYYWLGFAAGVRVLFRREARESFSSNWRKRIRYFLVPIIFVEVIGMLVFFFEYLSLVGLDPTTVSLILGVHVVLVYVLDLALGRFRAWMEARGIQRVYLFGARLLKSTLPEPKFDRRQILYETGLILLIMFGIGLVTLYSG